jgi:uncharacterized membrane protein
VGLLLHTPVGRAVVAGVAALAIGTVAGLAILWPSDDTAELSDVFGQKTESAEVVDVAAAECRNPAVSDCEELTLELRSGPDTDARSTIISGDSGPAPDLGVGDRVRVTKNDVPPGSGPGAEAYALSEVERQTPMLWLLLVFSLLVVVFGRLRGALALIGLGVSLLVVAKFIVPAILEGEAPLAVAIVGAVAVMLATITLAHGVNAKSLAAILGTAGSLVLTVMLALLFTELAKLTGLSSEEATLLQASGTDVSLEGLVLAGMVIGALGVLDDVTVSQASTVMALRRANPTHGVLEIYRGAIEVGRDHVAATVNTLVLAYVGASLPILLIFGVGDVAFLDAINREAVAEQVVAMLVGSIGLIAAVPLTTGLAAVLATRMPTAAVTGEHAHAH